MFALSTKNCFMSIDLLVLNNKNNICESWVVDNFSHIDYQGIDSFVINFVFFQLANIQYANIIEPLATIESSKNE